MEQLIQSRPDAPVDAARRLEGRAALVIGASRGIGEATVAALVAQGARVVMASRSVERMEDTAGRLRAAGGAVCVCRTDVRDADAIAAAVAMCLQEFGRLDIAVNNAAANNVRRPLHEIEDDVFDEVLATNLRGTFVAMKHEVRAMLASGRGSIVNTASAASLVAFPGMAAYVASKHAVAGLTKAAALEYAAQRIRVNAVAPGAVLTEMLLAGSASTPEGRARVEGATPMHRIASPEEIAAAITWLASDDASFITGVTLPVDGGYTLP